MSNQQLRDQHNEVVTRNREARLATLREAQRLADQRAAARATSNT